MDEMMMKSPSQTLNLVNIVYDDEFVSIINSLSASIKDFYKSSKKSVSELNNTLTSFSNQTLVSKCILGEIKANNSFDKVSQLSERLENMKDTQASLDQTINSIDRDLIKFFEDAKVLFKKMKFARNKKIEDLIYKGNQFNITHNSISTKKYMSSRTSSAVKAQSVIPSQMQMQMQKQIKSTRENKPKAKNDVNELLSSHNKININWTKPSGSNHDSRSVSPNYKIVSINNNSNTDTHLSSSKLALNVISFLEEMIRLQESIMKRTGNVVEQKKKFEQQKNELKKLAEKTLNLTNAYLTAKTNSYSNAKENQYSNSNSKSKENLHQSNHSIQCPPDNVVYGNNSNSNDQLIIFLKKDIKQLEDANAFYKEEIKNLAYENLIKTNQYEDSILSLKEEIKTLMNELKKKTNQYQSNKTLETELNKIKGQLSSEQDDQKLNVQIKNQYDTLKLNNEIQMLQNQIKENDIEKHSLVIRNDELKKQIEQLSSEIMNAKETMSNMKDQTRTLMNEINKKNEEKNRALIDNDQLREDNDTLIQEKTVLSKHHEEEKRKMKEEIDQLTIKNIKESNERKKAISSNETKDKDIDNKKAEILSFNQEIARLKQMRNSIEEEKKKQLKKETDNNKLLKSDLNKKENTIEQLNQIIKENIMTINELKQKGDFAKRDNSLFGITKLLIATQEPIIIKSSSDNKQLLRNKSIKDKEIELMNRTINQLKNTNEDILTNLSIKIKLIDELEKKADKISKDKLSIKKELEAMTQAYNAQLNSVQTIQNENKLLKEEAHQTKKRIDELEKTVLVSNSKNDKSNHQSTMIEELRSNLSSQRKEFEKQIAVLNMSHSSKVKELGDRLSTIDQLKTIEKKGYEDQIKDLHQSILAKENQINELNTKVANDAIEIKDKGTSIDNLTNELMKLKQMNNQSAEEKGNQLKIELELNHQLSTKLQMKELELSKQNNILNTELNKTKLLSETISSQRSMLNELENKTKDLTNKITHYESVMESNANEAFELKKQIKLLQSDNDNKISLLSIEKKGLCEDIAKLNQAISQLQIDNNSLLNQLKDQSSALVNQKEKLNDSLSQLAQELDKAKESKLQEDQLQLQYKTQYHDLEEINKELQLEVSNLIDDKRELVNELNKMQKEIDRVTLLEKDAEEQKRTEIMIIQEEFRKVLKENEVLIKTKEAKSVDGPISPKTHTIILDKKYNSMIWVLIQKNDSHEYRWVLIDHIPNIKEYNEYKTEAQEQMEFSEHMQITIKKFEQKEDTINKLSFEVSKLKDQAIMNNSNASNSKQKSKLSDKGLFGMNNNNNNNSNILVNSQQNQTIGSNNNEDSVPLEKFNAVLKELNDANKRMTLIQNESMKLRKIIREKEQNSSKINDISNNENNILGNINTDDNKSHRDRDRDENDTVEQLESQLKYFKNLYKELNNSMTVLVQQIKVLLSHIQATSKTKGIIESICKIIKLNENETNQILVEDSKKKGILGNFWKKKD